MRCLFTLLLLMLATSCGFKRIAGLYFDKRCHRDLPRIWSGASCPSENESPVEAVPEEKAPEPVVIKEAPCPLAINPSLCIRDGIEHSVWVSPEHQAQIALGFNLSFQNFYEFKTDGRYTHYLFFKHPFLNKVYFEKREGRLDVQANDTVDAGLYSHTLDFRPTLSTCSNRGRPSLFQLFDATNRSQIARKDFRLTLRFPDIDFDLAVKDFESLLARVILEILEIQFEVLLAPLSPNYWKEVLTGPLQWKSGNLEELAQMLASSEELCLSDEGIRSLTPRLNIPPEVQLILQSQ